jgi:hypothetical protein
MGSTTVVLSQINFFEGEIEAMSSEATESLGLVEARGVGL